MAEKARNAFLGMGDDCRLLLQTFDEYFTKFWKRVGKDRSISTFKNYSNAHRYLVFFLKYKCKVEDILFKELNRDFIENTRLIVQPDDTLCTAYLRYDRHAHAGRTFGN